MSDASNDGSDNHDGLSFSRVVHETSKLEINCANNNQASNGGQSESVAAVGKQEEPQPGGVGGGDDQEDAFTFLRSSFTSRTTATAMTTTMVSENMGILATSFDSLNYNMSHPRRGRCLIINNCNFDPSKLQK